MTKQPTDSVAAQIAAEFCGQGPQSVSRFPMGIGHWVYDVRGPEAEQFVVRIGSSEQREDFVGALHWSKLLRPVGVPLPSLLASGEWEGMPYMVLERLSGEDLGVVYETLALDEKKAIAENVCRIQSLVASLGEGQGYGYVRLPVGPYRASWREVIDESIARSRSRMELTKLIGLSPVQRLVQSANRFESYFSRVRPVPFLDDTTTKNVLVHQGVLSGIVDVDWICFGDPLLTVALTRTSLLNSGRDVDYTDHWSELLALTPEQRAVMRFYTALFCLDFMSELGHRFNRETATIDAEGVERLERILDDNLNGL
jgi:aminoglycoside phosphotransferase (APT) family kinase protein